MRRVFLDVEVYRNYFLALFMSEQGRFKAYEIFNEDNSRFPADEILRLLEDPGIEFVTFNGDSYDIPVLTLALVERDTQAIKKASDRIIEKNVRPWHFYQDEGLKAPDMDHIDIINVAPGLSSLKIYGGRLGTKRLQDLPIHPTATITACQVPQLRAYCKNDLVNTKELFDDLSEEIDLRRAMSKTYGVDLRSKSDAQIAEAVLKAEYVRLTGGNPPKVAEPRRRFYYEPPAYIKFNTEQMQGVLDTVCSAEMVVKDDTGHVTMPKQIASLKIRIGDTNYKIGIGGLHSQESEVAHFTDDDNVLIDRDVESYYPRMMLNMNMQPGGFGEYFNEIYGSILEERLQAKHAGDKVKSASLKIVLNGTFGKTSNKYSALYSPDFMIRTTLTGQLTILMLIEALERCGIPVVSANTDGIVVKCPRKKRDVLNTVIEAWERRSGLKTEETVYRALYSRDVNNYIAVGENGKVKAKGVYGPVSIRKNPQNAICSEAVIAYLTEGAPLAETVQAETDVRKFLTLRTVTGGAVKNGKSLGKAIRWYYAKGINGAIHYAKNGNMVPRTEGAKPLMNLPEKVPTDLDHGWYVRECEEMLMAIGAKPRPHVEKIPRKNSKAWKALRDEGKIVEGAGGKWKWA